MDHLEKLNSEAERRILRRGFGTGNLREFHRLRAEGFYLSAEWIEDVKRDNPGWRTDLVFARYADEMVAGRHARPSSRPKLHEVDTPWIMMAEWEYTILLRYLRKLSSRKGLAAWVVRHHPERDTTAPPHQLAAEIVVARRRLPISWRRLINRVSAFNRKWNVEPRKSAGL